MDVYLTCPKSEDYSILSLFYHIFFFLSRLKGVCVENGVVVACYDQGIVCWNAHTAETILESPQSDAHYISGKYIITITNDQVNLKHAITFLLSAEDQSL